MKFNLVILTILLFALEIDAQFVKHDISTMSTCREVRKRPNYDCRWSAGLDRTMDYQVRKGRIAAYKIKWFSGRWSGWYVPGINDIDYKYNKHPKSCRIPYKRDTLRLMWSYFYDHTHKYIICMPSTSNGPRARPPNSSGPSGSPPPSPQVLL